MIKAVLFDFDGTLVDSERFHHTCASELLGPYGISFDFDYYLENFAGIPLPENAKTIVDRFQPDITPEEIVSEYESYSYERMKTYEFPLMPYALEAIKFFSSKGIPMAIATGSRREDVDMIISKTGIGAYFEFEVTRSEVIKSKPDPETYQVCIDRFGFSRDEYLVFEDTPNGSKSAKAAELTCWAVQATVSKHKNLNIADRIYLTLEDAIKDLKTNQT